MDDTPNLRSIKYLVEALRYLLQFPNRIRKREGICDNVFLVCSTNPVDFANVYSAMKFLFRKWPKFSGDISYPIPVPADKESENAEEEYYEAETHGYMWDKYNSYGALRYELVHFMIETGEQLLKENKEVDFKV